MIDYTSLRTQFLSAPGDDLVDKFIMQLQAVPQMAQLFGQSFANYARFDWPLQALPAINVVEAQSESKTSDHGYLTGTIQVQVYWPAEFRRSDLMRIPNLFKGILENFISSKYASDMLDEYYAVQRPCKVDGLNEFGKMLTYSPNVEGINDGESVPVTIVDVQYRIDLRAFERALEFQGRTMADPFETTLYNLTSGVGEIDGLSDDKTVDYVLPVELNFGE